MVTVGIAAYNVGQFIEKSLLSVLNQDYPELEILVIDDNSKDNTYNIVEQISRTHHRGASIRIIRNDNNQGTANVRNQCIDEAKGNYIFFLMAMIILPLMPFQSCIAKQWKHRQRWLLVRIVDLLKRGGERKSSKHIVINQGLSIMTTPLRKC